MKLFLIGALLTFGTVSGTERRGHHHHHHQTVSEILENVENSIPKLNEKQAQAMAKFENHAIFNEVWAASRHRLQERMHQVEERQKRQRRLRSPVVNLDD